MLLWTMVVITTCNTCINISSHPLVGVYQKVAVAKVVALVSVAIVVLGMHVCSHFVNLS